MSLLALRRRALILLAALTLAACADGRDLGEAQVELSNFQLGHNIVIDAAAVQGPLSRRVEPGAWQSSLQAEVGRRFSRYQGDRLYHLALHVDAYVLAVPGIPIVASPRSALIVGVHVWDDALGRPLNEERRQFTVLEHLSGESILGSGLTQSAEQQMATLSRNAVVLIERWLAEHPEWFPPASAAPVAGAVVTPAVPGAAPIPVPVADPVAPVAVTVIAPVTAPGVATTPAPVALTAPVVAPPAPAVAVAATTPPPPVTEADLLPRRPRPTQPEVQAGP